jgi:AbrB family looped-hinge helix DNA binding protein
MPRKQEVDSDRLIEAVKSGQPATEIMREFRIQTSAQLKSHYLDALVEKGMATAIRRSRAASSPKTEEPGVRVSKRGSIALPRELVEDFGYSEGDAFEVRRTKSGLILRAV